MFRASQSLPVILMCLAIQVEAQKPSDVCLAMASDAAHNVSLNTSSQAYYITLHHEFCYADGSTNDSEINTKGSAVIDAIPVAAAFASSDKSTKFTQFCQNFQDAAAASGSSFDYKSVVVDRALDAVNQCVAMVTTHGMSLTYTLQTPNTVVVNLGIPSGQSVDVHGITAPSSVSCVGSDLAHKGQSITYKTGVGQTISANSGATSITCSRTPSSNVGGTAFYDASSVNVDTSAGPLDIYWPQESTLPLTIASQVQAEIQNLQAAVSFNALPVGTILPWYQKNGNPPAGWVKCDGSDTAHCPNLAGIFLRGSSPADVGSTGGSATAPVGQHGSNNRHPDGNGWSLDGSHYLSNDNVTVNTIPPFTSVLYILKISNH
jgi:hypothetical protein